MTNLKSTIEGLATEFAISIIGALRTASIDELTGVAGLGRAARTSRATSAPVESAGRKRGRGRLARRTTNDIGRMVESIVGLLQKHPDGLRAEQIREALACQAKELPRPLADGLAEGRITKTGQKRATTYFAGGKGDTGKKRGGRGRPRKRSA